LAQAASADAIFSGRIQTFVKLRPSFIVWAERIDPCSYERKRDNIWLCCVNRWTIAISLTALIKIRTLSYTDRRGFLARNLHTSFYVVQRVPKIEAPRIAVAAIDNLCSTAI